MENLNLHRLWEIMNIISEKQEELHEESKWVSFFGNKSSYCIGSFEDFIQYYSFKIEGDKVIVFNDAPEPWEDFTTNDFSYVLIYLLKFSDEEVLGWLNQETEIQLSELENKKEQDKIYIKQQIESLEQRLKMLSK